MECYYCHNKDAWGVTCHECGHQFCMEHKVPESHDCPFCPTYKPTSSLRAPYETPAEKVDRLIFRLDKEARKEMRKRQKDAENRGG